MKSVRLNKITRNVIVENIMDSYDTENKAYTQEFFGIPKHKFDFIQNVMKLVKSTECYKTSVSIVQQANASGVRMKTANYLSMKGLPSSYSADNLIKIKVAKHIDSVTGSEKIVYLNDYWQHMYDKIEGTDFEGNKGTLHTVLAGSFPATDGHYLNYDVNCTAESPVLGIHSDLKALIKTYRKEAQECGTAEAIFKQDRESFLESITNQLDSVNTTKQLEEQWPEVMRFVPDSIIKPSTGIALPMAQLDEINNVLSNI